MQNKPYTNYENLTVARFSNSRLMLTARAIRQGEQMHPNYSIKQSFAFATSFYVIMQSPQSDDDIFSNWQKRVMKNQKNHTFSGHPLSWFSWARSWLFATECFSCQSQSASPHRRLIVYEGDKHVILFNCDGLKTEYTKNRLQNLWVIQPNLKWHKSRIVL